MASYQSSFHPIFWMHHNNVDRIYEQACAPRSISPHLATSRLISPHLAAPRRTSRGLTLGPHLCEQYIRLHGDSAEEFKEHQALLAAHGEAGFPDGPWGRYEPCTHPQTEPQPRPWPTPPPPPPLTLPWR